MLSRLGPAVLVPERWRKHTMLACALCELLLAGGLLLSGHPFFRWAARRVLRGVHLCPVGTAAPAPGRGVRLLRRGQHDPGGTALAGPHHGADGHGRGAGLDAGDLRLETLAGTTWTHVPSMIGGVLVLAALSPEIEEAVARLRHRAPCEQRRFDPATALSRLRSSTAWRAHVKLLSDTEPVDSWRELCWRFFVYPGQSHAGEPVDMVFAVYLSGRHPAVRVAMVGLDGQPVETTSLPESLPVSA